MKSLLQLYFYFQSDISLEGPEIAQHVWVGPRSYVLHINNYILKCVYP